MRTVKQARRPALKAMFLGGAALAALAAGAQAQTTQDPGSQSAQLEEIVVTGSRIARPNLESNSPVSVVGEDLLQAQGFENIADIAATLPQFAASFGTSRTQSTFSGATASGLNTVNLRNLGPNRSLILINGRRVVDAVTGGGGVDFNLIPSQNIERLEIVTGGASAVYGADAVAGVVNVITKKDFEGFEIGGSYGIAEKGDNENPNGYLLFGTKYAEGRGHVLLTVEADYQGEVSCKDRTLCSDDFLWLPPADPVRGPTVRSGIGLGGRFIIGGVNYTRRNGSFTDANGNPFVFQTAIDGFNRNAQRTLAIPTERYLFGAETQYEVAEGLNAFVEFSYGLSETDAPFEGHPFQSSSDRIGGATGTEVTIPVSNPFIPQVLRDRIPATQTEISWLQRFQTLSPRGATNTRQQTRAVGGLRGDLGALGDYFADFDWEASYTYGRFTLDSTTNGVVSLTNLYEGLRVEPLPGLPGQFRCVNPVARAAGCVPINPFADYTPAMAEYLTIDASTRAENELQDAVAFVSGPLFELPAGALRASVGVELRDFSSFTDQDEAINEGTVTGNQILDNEKLSRTTKEVFGEAIIPVLKDLPGAESLTLELAYRYSDTEGVREKYDTWRYGGEWSPIESVRFRANRARAVRTPLPGELTGGFETAGVVNDPCAVERRNANPTRAANCAADGVPADYNPPQLVRQGVQGFVVGNPNLDPEEAITTTYGVVFTPEFVPGLAVTVDRFDIDLEKVITTLGRQTQVDQCYDTVERLFCNVVTRGATPLIPGATYALLGVNDQTGNTASFRIKGIDVEATYGFDVAELTGSTGDLGELNLRLAMTFYDKADYKPSPDAEVQDLLGVAGGDTTLTGYLKRQGTFNAFYRLDPFNVAWTTRYIGSAKTADEPDYPKIGDRFYHNLRLGLNLEDTYEFYVGVNNLADSKPPLFPSGTSGTQALDTIPAYYDVFGRSYYAGFRARF